MQPNESFCPNCGAKSPINQGQIFCPHCNTPNSPQNVCCVRCGKNLYKQGHFSAPLIIGLSVTALISVIVVLCIIFIPRNNKNGNEASVPTIAVTTEQPTHPPHPTPYGEPDKDPTPIPIKQHKTALYYITYSEFTDYDYAFSCPYPNNFYKISPLSDFTRLSLSADDKSGTIYICGTVNSSG